MCESEWSREREPDATQAGNTYTSLRGWKLNGTANFCEAGGVSVGGTYEKSVSATTVVTDFTVRTDDTSWMFYYTKLNGQNEKGQEAYKDHFSAPSRKEKTLKLYRTVHDIAQYADSTCTFDFMTLFPDQKCLKI